MLLKILQEVSRNNEIVSSSDAVKVEPQPKCDLFGPFSYIVQFALGVLSFMVLICNFSS